MKNDKGITLLALVATVVILAFLTLVTINIALHRDTITKVKNAENEITSKLEDGEGRTDSAKREYNEMDDILSSWNKENPSDGNTTGGNTTGGETTCAHTSTTATDNGDGTHTIKCTKCGEKLITEKHEYLNGKCTVCQSALVIGAKINYHEYIGTDGKAFSGIMPSHTSLKTTRGSKESYDSDATYSVVNNSGIEWIVLGEEGNQIKITTKNIVQPTSGGCTKRYTDDGFVYLYLQGQTGYTNFVSELNKIGAVYGHGKYADTTKFTTSGGRSIKKEDLGYKALTRRQSYKFAMHSDGYIYRYEPSATEEDIKNETSTIGGTLSTFKYMDLDVSNLTVETEASYKLNELTVDNPVVTMYDYIYSGSMILNTSVSMADEAYWLASRCLTYGEGVEGVYYGALYVNTSGEPGYVANLCISAYDYTGSMSGVRPVVYLQSGIKLSYDETTGYTIEE